MPIIIKTFFFFISILKRKNISFQEYQINHFFSFRLFVFQEKAKPIADIIFIHGMTPMGIEDERQINICQSLANIGYRVLAPEIEEIKKCRLLLSENITKLEQQIISLQNHPVIKLKEFSFFSPSYSGSLSMIIATKKNLSHQVRAICCVGSFFDFVKIFKYWMENNEVDSYGRLIILREYFIDLLGENSDLVEGLKLAIKDNWYKSNNLEKYKKQMDPKAYSELEKILTNREKKYSLINDLSIFVKKIIQGLEFNEIARKINCSVLLVHGKNDLLVPCNESVEMSQSLRKKKKTHKLLLTSILDHANPSISIGRIGGVIRLIFYFSWFLKAAKRPLKYFKN